MSYNLTPSISNEARIKLHFDRCSYLSIITRNDIKWWITIDDKQSLSINVKITLIVIVASTERQYVSLSNPMQRHVLIFDSQHLNLNNTINRMLPWKWYKDNLCLVYTRTTHCYQYTMSLSTISSPMHVLDSHSILLHINQQSSQFLHTWNRVHKRLHTPKSWILHKNKYLILKRLNISGINTYNHLVTKKSNRIILVFQIVKLQLIL